MAAENGLKLTVTNVSDTPVFVSDLYSVIKPQGSVVVTRSPSDLPSMYALQKFVADGILTLTYEASSKLIDTIQGQPVDIISTPPVTDEKLGYDGAKWVPQEGGGGLTPLDPSPEGSYALANVTVDEFGRVVSAEAGTLPTLDPSPEGRYTNIASVSVDDKGRVTNIESGGVPVVPRLWFYRGIAVVQVPPDSPAVTLLTITVSVTANTSLLLTASVKARNENLAGAPSVALYVEAPDANVISPSNGLIATGGDPDLYATQKLTGQCFINYLDGGVYSISITAANEGGGSGNWEVGGNASSISLLQVQLVTYS